MTVLRRSSRPSGPPTLVLALVAAGFAAACRAPEVERDNQVVVAVQHGRYDEALAEAERLAKANPDDAAVQQLYRDAQVASILHQGRQDVFHGELERGLARFEEARALAPGHPTVESWIRKTRAQLAVRWLDEASTKTGPEHLDEAEQAYEKVLEYDPHNPDGKRGLSYVLLLKNYRAGMSKTYFDDGLSSFRELLLEQARRAFMISRRYRENEPAVARAEQVESMMAEERLAQAKELEATGRFFAARNEYRLVLLIEPDSVEGRAGLDRMDRETRAMRTMAAADMAIRRGALATAEESLAEAQVLTDAQREELQLLQSSVEERRLEDMYLEALSLEQDYRYPEGVAAYDRLLAVAPDYQDAARRKATLEEFISLTEEFYAKALAAADDAEAEEYLRAIHPVIWPEYRDVVERLKAIEARKAEAEAGSGAGGDEPPAEEPPADEPEDGR